MCKKNIYNVIHITYLFNMENNYNNDILPIDLFNQFWILFNRRGLFDTRDMFKSFDDINREMDPMFNDVSSSAPKI